MVGIKAIIQGVDPQSEEEYMKYHVIYRMDGKTPIRIGTDTLADEYLDRSNMRLGWDEESLENVTVQPPAGDMPETSTL